MTAAVVTPTIAGLLFLFKKEFLYKEDCCCCNQCICYDFLYFHDLKISASAYSYKIIIG